MYNSEKNKAKTARYRTRKGLRDAGFSEDEIEQIVSRYDWTNTTSSSVLSQYVERDTPQSRESVNEGETSNVPLWFPVAIVATVFGVCLGIPLLVSKFAK